MTHITFPRERPEYCGRDFILAFTAVVDGKRVQCAITAEALEDHFGAVSLREDDLISAFDAHRKAIEHAARRMLDEVGSNPILLHSGYFRFCEQSDAKHDAGEV
ncbi:MAG: DUF1488 domain-containing protein [Terracidiphilus sp.]|jgi:hypothetical protein|nr:DUF1488 domain-containing protein [Terracidiphilus sp.]